MAEASCAAIGFGRSRSLRQGGGGGGGGCGARKGGWGRLLLLRGSEEGVEGGVEGVEGARLAPLWMALTFRDRWCRSYDSSSTLAFWPACILNPLTD